MHILINQNPPKKWKERKSTTNNSHIKVQTGNYLNQ